MAGYSVEPADLAVVERVLRKHAQLKHIQLRKRAAVITLVSGPPDDPVAHARFRRVAIQAWELEMPTHTGRWEKTYIRGTLADLMHTLISDFPWTLTPICPPENPARTHDPRY